MSKDDMWDEVSHPEPKKPSSLDERLREIDRCIGVKVINNPVGFDGAIIDARLRLTDDVIAQIKQAFKEEGWVKMSKDESKRWSLIKFNDQFKHKKASGIE